MFHNPYVLESANVLENASVLENVNTSVKEYEYPFPSNKHHGSNILSNCTSCNNVYNISSSMDC